MDSSQEIHAKLKERNQVAKKPVKDFNSANVNIPASLVSKSLRLPAYRDYLMIA